MHKEAAIIIPRWMCRSLSLVCVFIRVNHKSNNTNFLSVITEGNANLCNQTLKDFFLLGATSAAARNSYQLDHMTIEPKKKPGNENAAKNFPLSFSAYVNQMGLLRQS